MDELFTTLPDVLDAKALAQALNISKSGAYALMNDERFPTLYIGSRKLVTKPDLIRWIGTRTRKTKASDYSMAQIQKKGGNG